ncbi:protein phosphatase 2C domain-containing protein [Arthrobacter sp. ISL-48]|uniref:PP2C family protein-serine/threonine phosphatase n=1 Tax=Arthrobacter sp. ISL-48 TaxID=2819110 RepID=UPI001BEC10E8|nr:PP2C family serine/threonine-protein phosphatase [Arthrobacter sp. ISL-48]MBT2533436.1 protein phosphatase 2C domain-containing protein [Arthrobacter sp. ISL-48]
MAGPETPANEDQPVQRPLIMRYAARSDVGRIRAKNDDSAYVGRHLAVVADGMGGHAGGDVASAATVLDMLHLDRGDYDDDDAGTVLADEIQTANSLLSELVHINPKLAGMGTTVTALLLAEGKLHFAHIGDSRAYRLRDGVFEQVSVDHTFVQRLIDEGRLRPEEAETHPHKNVLMRVLGDVDASPELDLDTLDVKPGERWLLCSDGLNYVAGHVVERTVRETKDLRECVETLVDLTLEAGSPDNVTVVMVEIVEETPDDVNTAAVDVVPAAPVTEAAASGPTVGAAASSPAVEPDDAGETTQDPPPKAAPLNDAPAEDAPAAGKPADDTTTFRAPSASDSDSGTADSDDADSDTGATTSGGSGASDSSSSTDPHLGEHLSAEVLRQELASRPHELVGAAASAAESGSIPTIAGRTVARRAATVLTHKAETPALEADDPLARPPRRWVTVSIAASVLIVLTVGLWLGYAWTQTRYYIGEYDSKVAIFNGVSQRLGPIELSSLEAVTEIRMDSLPPFSQQRVRQTVPARDLYDAQRIVKNLELTGTTSPADECLTPSPSPSATTAPATTAPPPAPSDPAAASATPPPSSSPTATTCEGGQ